MLSTPLRAFRDNLQHWLGGIAAVARLLKVQFTSNEGISNDAPYMSVKWDRPLHWAPRALLFTKSVWVL